MPLGISKFQTYNPPCFRGNDNKTIPAGSILKETDNWGTPRVTYYYVNVTPLDLASKNNKEIELIKLPKPEKVNYYPGRFEVLDRKI